MDDHVEIARRALSAFFQKPRPDFDTMNELMAADHEFVDALSESARGSRGFEEWLRVFNETWETWATHVEEPVAIDDERVLLGYRFLATGRGSQVSLEQEMATVVTVRGGKIVRTEVFSSPADARASLAL